MPAIICNEHGRQLAVLVCPHVEASFNHKARLTRMIPVRGTWIDTSESMVLFWCCSECSKQYALGEENKELDYTDIPADFESSLLPICHLCFNRWRGESS